MHSCDHLAGSLVASSTSGRESQAGATEWMMLDEDERGYFERRAETEMLMAAATADPRVCASHYNMANLYLGLVFENGDGQGIGEGVEAA